MNYPSHLFGMRILVNPLAVTTAPVQKHKKRRNQSEAYHRRTQKKWTKRFGVKSTPALYRIEDHTLVVHPTIYEQLRKAVQMEQQLWTPGYPKDSYGSGPSHTMF